MYKVFVNECPLVLTNFKPEHSVNHLFNLSDVSILTIIKKMFNNELRQVCIYDESEMDIIDKIKFEIPVVVASGGYVVNVKGKVLFIYRNDKWDLPKGKVDEGETVEEAAVREVEEETGVNGLKINNFILKTYHVFNRKGDFKLKEVYWYNMYTDCTKKLTPQLEEGITKVKWKGPKKTKKALKNSYKNIQLLFD